VTVVLDASVLIGAMERAEAPARRALVEALAAARSGAPGPYVSALTVAELMRGAAHDDAVAEIYEALFAAMDVREVTEAQAREAAALAAAADARGRPSRQRPGLVDAIVAALAADLGAELLATDPHFYELPGLRLRLLPEADS
jgi:predicted nucleic acid-binding protein